MKMYPTTFTSNNEMEGLTTTSLAYPVLKWVLGHTAAAAVATFLGFLIIKPKSVHEAMVRIFGTLACSFTFGPILVAVVHAKWPVLFESAAAVATAEGIGGMGEMYVSMPLLVIAGLPAWWILGWTINFMEKRKGQDLAQIIQELLARKTQAERGELPRDDSRGDNK